MSNEKQMALAHLMYCQDYDERFAPAKGWMDLMGPYVKRDDIYHCPSLTAASGAYGYAFDSDLSMKSQSEIANPRSQILLYDSSKFGRSESDGAVSFPYPGRHRERNIIGYADGHVSRHQQGTERDPEPEYPGAAPSP